MKENLLERFARSKHGPRAENKQKVDIWVLPQKPNLKVREYYQNTRKPANAGPWVDRPEVPTAAELLDQDGEGSSSSEIVEIVPNKPKGAWESTGKQYSDPTSLSSY